MALAALFPPFGCLAPPHPPTCQHTLLTHTPFASTALAPFLLPTPLPTPSYPLRILSKTMAYLQTKRPDLEPKPGFMRQLVALDQSLQRVTRSSARGKDDPVLRKCSEWDPALVLGAWGALVVLVLW